MCASLFVVIFFVVAPIVIVVGDVVVVVVIVLVLVVDGAVCVIDFATDVAKVVEPIESAVDADAVATAGPCLEGVGIGIGMQGSDSMRL
jgi:hypothetical protein